MDTTDNDEEEGVPTWLRQNSRRLRGGVSPGPNAGASAPGKNTAETGGEGLQGWSIPEVESSRGQDASANSDEKCDSENGIGSKPAAGPETTTTSDDSKTWGHYFRESFQRDGRLLLITLALLVCMNIPYVKWVLYPFEIFSTWIHELCHGFAALFAGGAIDRLEVYPDTSGLAYTSVASARRGFVISAGYQGTAVVGCLLLLFRRTKRGPRTGTVAVAALMVLSCLLWIRNVFGFVAILVMGLALAGVGWKLPSAHMRNVYVVLAVTCALNAITSVRGLFGDNQQVNGEPSSTDAHSMAEFAGGTSTGWAVLWLCLALASTVVGILFAVPGPDEVADFACCGICQDLGLFKCCNYPGQRITSTLKDKWTNRKS